MNKTWLTFRFILALVLACLCLAGQCRAVTVSTADADNDSGLSGRQILKMGLDRFVDVYSVHRHHKPDEAACRIYHDYKEPDNKLRLARLSSYHRGKIHRLYADLKSWKETALQLRLDYCPGTAWINELVTSPAYLEECLGQVIGYYEPSKHYPHLYSVRPLEALHGNYKLLVRCEKYLVQGQVDRPDDFRHTLPVFRKKTATLDKTLRHQPLAVQRIIAVQLAGDL